MESEQKIYLSDEWEVLTPSGWQSFDGVVASINKDTILIDGLECTANHKIKINDSFVDAETLPHTEGKRGVMVYDLLNVRGGNEYYTNEYVSHNCDEFAHVENHIADEFFTSVFPTLSSGKETKILMSSTPKGYNLFYKFWTDAVNGSNGFKYQFFDWTANPDRDQKWADEQKAVLGEVKYSQEISCEFLGSSKSLLTGDTLRKLAHKEPQFEHRTGQFRGLKIYEMPEKDRKYVMTVDVSRGRHLDSSAFMIFDVTEYPHIIVASYNNSDIPPLLYAGVCYQMAKRYNEAYILVEINDIGGQVAEEIYHTYEYGEMFWTKTGDVLGKKGSDDFPGIRTTKKTKRIGCANLKDIVEKNQLIIEDWLTIQELATFVQSDSGNWEADEGFRDDMVACLWLYAWLVTQPWFVDLTDRSIRNKMYNDLVEKMEADLLPPMSVSNGNDFYEENTPEAIGIRELF